MLRFSVDPGPQRANLCAVYALFGVILIPISFLAIRLANSYIHPTVFNRHGPQMADVPVLDLLRLPGGDALAGLPSTGSSCRQAARREPEELRELLA